MPSRRWVIGLGALLGAVGAGGIVACSAHTDHDDCHAPNEKTGAKRDRDCSTQIGGNAVWPSDRSRNDDDDKERTARSGE